jgi:ribosome-interacting GTPase 1
MRLPLIIVGTKLELPGAQENAQILQELYGEKFEVVCVSALQNIGLDQLKQAIYKNLFIILNKKAVVEHLKYYILLRKSLMRGL